MVSTVRRFSTYCGVGSVVLWSVASFAGQPDLSSCSSSVQDIRRAMQMLRPCVFQDGQDELHLLSRVRVGRRLEGDMKSSCEWKGIFGSGDAQALPSSIQKVQGYQRRLAQCAVADQQAQVLSQELENASARMQACVDIRSQGIRKSVVAAGQDIDAYWGQGVLSI